MATDTISKRREELLSRPVGRLLFDLSWPMSFGLFAIIAFNIVDTFYIGKLGQQPLAALGFSFPVIFGLSAIAIGMSTGAASVVSRALGANEEARARDLVLNTMIFVTLCAVALAFAVSAVSVPIFRLLGAPESLIPIIHQYMDVWYLGLPFLIVPIVLNGMVRAVGESVFPSVLMVLGAGINAVVSPILIFGYLGAPEMGMAGAAWATILARAVIAVVCVIHLARLGLFRPSKRALRRFGICVREVSRFGAPAFLAQLVSPVASGIVTRLLSSEGPAAVAAFAIGARLEVLILVPFFALQVGIGPFIGQHVGAGATHRLGAAQRTVIGFSLLWGAAAGVILYAFGADLAALFSRDAETIALADRYLNYIALGIWGAGLMATSIGIFNPLGYPNVGMAISILRYLGLYAGLAVVLSGALPETLRISGIFAAAPLSYALAGLVGAALIPILLKRPRGATARNATAPRKVVGHDDLRQNRHPLEHQDAQSKTPPASS